jgi:hypothetical protein
LTVKGNSSIHAGNSTRHRTLAIRVYLSDAAPWHTIESQMAALADVLPGATVFTDELGIRGRRAMKPELLVRRASMLRGTKRQDRSEVIWVAALPVLAADEADLRIVLTAIEARGATLRAASGAIFTPGMSHDAIVAAWREAVALSRARGAGRVGGEATRAKLEPVYRAKCEAVKHLWGNPLYTAREVCGMAGVSINTMNKHLGKTWTEAARGQKARLRREQKRKEQEQ